MTMVWYIKGTLVLFKKDLMDAFNSPFIYIIASLFSLIIGWLFFNYVIAAKDLTSLSITNAVLAPVFGNINLFFIFLSPMLTMGLLTQERKNHTLELLLLSKLNSSQIVIGKFLAGISMAWFLLLLTIIFPVMIGLTGHGDLGMIISTYVGFSFTLMCFISVGLFASSLTDNPIVAAFMGFAFLMLVMLLAVSLNATNNWMLGEIAQYLSIAHHFESFVRGEIRSYDIVYFLSFTGFFLWLTKESLETRKW